MERLEERGILLLRTDPYRFRLVTHHGITAEDIDRTVDAIREVLAGEDP
jgi:threonine aldolase